MCWPAIEEGDYKYEKMRIRRMPERRFSSGSTSTLRKDLWRRRATTLVRLFNGACHWQQIWTVSIDRSEHSYPFVAVLSDHVNCLRTRIFQWSGEEVPWLSISCYEGQEQQEQFQVGTGPIIFQVQVDWTGAFYGDLTCYRYLLSLSTTRQKSRISYSSSQWRCCIRE